MHLHRRPCETEHLLTQLWALRGFSLVGRTEVQSETRYLCSTSSVHLSGALIRHRLKGT